MLAIPAAAGGSYTVYRNFFATEVVCRNVQSAIVGVMEKNVPPETKRGLLHKDFSEFEIKCSKVDPDSFAIFQAAMKAQAEELAPKAPTLQTSDAASSTSKPVAMTPDGFPVAVANAFGRSASGDVRGWVALTRAEADRQGEPNFDGYALSLTVLPPPGTVLQTRHLVPVWLEPQAGANDPTRLQGRVPAGACARVITARPAGAYLRTWGEVVPVPCPVK